MTFPHYGLFFGLLYQDSDICQKISHRIYQEFGDAVFTSQEFSYDHTDYYCEEMGSNLKKRFIFVNQSIPADQIYIAKTWSVQQEAAYSIENQRQINIDPGGINAHQLILLSTKNYCHRIPLRDNIYAEITMIYQQSRYQEVPWTYPDFRGDRYQPFFKDCWFCF